MKKCLKLGAVFLSAAMVFLTGCGGGGAGDQPETTKAAVPETTVPSETAALSETSEETGAMRAMYLTDPSGSVYFVDINNGTFFTAPIPDELYDISGNRTTADTLQAGYVLDIYGNGIMLESYPGQYPGVTKMTVVTEGTADNAAQYQELINSVYAEPDYSQPPYMTAEYTTSLASVGAALTMGGYEWNYVDENGNGQSDLACGSHILEWEPLIDLSLGETTTVTLTASSAPESAVITRWPVSDRNPQGESQTETPEGEHVSFSTEDGALVLEADPGYVYLIEAVFAGESASGSVQYGFYTK